MASDVQQNKTHVFTFNPSEIWAGASCAVYDPDGVLLESPSPSLDAVNTTVASATSSDVFVVSSATGVTRGNIYEVVDPTWGAAFAEVSSIDGTTVTLTAPLPAKPDDGATFKGVTQTVAITASSTGTRGLGFRVLLRSASGREMQQLFNVVRHPFDNPIAARDVREYVSNFFPSDPILSDEETLSGIAERAGSMLRGRLSTIGLYPHAYIDQQAFLEPARACMRAVLAEFNRIPAGADPVEYARSIQFDLRDLVSGIKNSLSPFDSDDDDAVADTEQSSVWSGYLER
tara:strand:- start:1879 stop:2742 length:864 start_codon:yes stop_codon:yes gene_type:complete